MGERLKCGISGIGFGFLLAIALIVAEWIVDGQPTLERVISKVLICPFVGFLVSFIGRTNWIASRKAEP
ncbi:MAG TPA: hypothetical protein VK934_07525 [Fimbriimonas sp.]|nr:hypothetical protein [Fimbriimonas sp.]